MLVGTPACRAAPGGTTSTSLAQAPCTEPQPRSVVPGLLSPLLFLAPIVLSYYTLAYSSFVALPLLLIAEELLWQEACPRRRHSILFFWALGFGLAPAIRIVWGLVYSPIVTRPFDLPPSPPGT